MQNMLHQRAKRTPWNVYFSKTPYETIAYLSRTTYQLKLNLT